MARLLLAMGAAAGFLGVALGAFGAHALRPRLDAEMLGIYQTAVQYHLVHALALVVTGLWRVHRDDAAGRVAGWAFTVGIVLFSGSLYALALTGVRDLGAVTPLGGVAFLVGWAALGMAALRTGTTST